VSAKPGQVAFIQQDCKKEKKNNSIKMKKIFFIFINFVTKFNNLCLKYTL
jgi:hypothetical protein